jgi:mRNA guanylyltransferase
MSAPVSIGDIATRLKPEDAIFHKESVADLLQRNNRNFAGAQPVSFARHHLTELQNRDYFMCEKTDGVRCLLYLTQVHNGDTGEGVEIQLLIDRKNDYYGLEPGQIHVPVPNDPGFGRYHLNTLLDGELVRQRFKDGRPERLAYLIFDCLAMDDELVTNRPFDKRLARIQENIAKPIKDFARAFPQAIANQPFQIEMKQFEMPYGMEMMFKDRIPNLPHGNDGLIFTCKETPYVAGTDQHILKWKPPHENTIDFRLLLGNFPMLQDDEGEFEDWDAKPEMELHVNQGQGGYTFYAPMLITDAEWTALKRLNQQIDGRIVECYRDPIKSMWRPKLDDGVPRFRDDKTDGNHISVVESVLGSIEDAVTEQDLIGAAQSIRNAFKERQKAREEEQRRAQEAEKRRRDEERKRRESQAPAAMKSETPPDDDGPKYED